MNDRTELPSCCELGGLYFSDDEQRCYRHTTEQQRARVEATSRRGRGIVAVLPAKQRIGWRGPLAWPYGPNIDVTAREALCDWAEPLGLKETTRTGRFSRWPAVTGGIAETDRWADHVTYWNRGGKPAVVISHPYLWGSTLTTVLAELLQRCEPSGLTVRQSAGWYGHGTPGIEIWDPAQLAV
jgi:hypothetical protein